MTTVMPNFLHIGPGKAGSTWVHETLSMHPQTYLTPAKDLYFFSRFYDRGAGWYANQFKEAPAESRIIGEVCPEYLWYPLSAGRVRETLGPKVRIMVTLRDPVARAFSAYLYQQKHGVTGRSFRQALEASPDMIDIGRYHTHLQRYLREFGAEQIHLTLFDDLRSDPQAFLDEVTGWLGIDRQPLSEEARRPQLPASRPRSAAMARMTKTGAVLARRHNGAELVGRVKRSRLVQQALYVPLGDRPTIPEPEAARIREELETELIGIESTFGISLRSRWGWS
jgi:hypothetical protein